MRRALWMGVAAAMGSIACGGEGEGPLRGFEGPGVAVRMAALALDEATDAVWDVEVETLGGDRVFAVRVTSEGYGDGQGAVSYVGPCVGGEDNRIHVWLRGVYTAASPRSGDPGGFGANTPDDDAVLGGSVDFVNPGRLTKTFPCQENGDTFVPFDVVVMRPARQGFFDIAVNFNDIYCSSKYDTGLVRMEEGVPVCGDNLLLHDPDASGARGRTHVLGLACTAGLGAETATGLYLDDLVITCPNGATLTIDPAAGAGNRRVGATWTGVTYAGPGALTDRLFQVTVFQGEEQLAGLNKVYWNIALGVKDLAGCSLATHASADDLYDPVAIGRTTAMTVDAGVVYPYLVYSVADLGVCAAYGLDDGAGVTTHYTATTGAGLAFDALYPDLIASCDDGRHNGDESDVDCGGTCPPCVDGRMCVVAGDCQGGVCVDGVCPGPSCDDGVHNGDETDVDCGGPCAPCGDGFRCETEDDCLADSRCWELRCRPETCFDEAHNQDETDLDCGGTCPPCADALACLVAEDCTSGVCLEGVCQAPTCTDGVMNGEETGVDCGGGDCDPCPEVVAMTAGGQFSCALLADQSAWCWGSNAAGKLGTGNNQSTSAPTAVVGLNDATIVRAGDGHACAVRADKTAWCWGSGSYYRLGTTTTTHQYTPQQVVGNQPGTMLEGVVDLAVGRYATCALLEDGSVWCWGGNNHGELGIGSTATKSRPQQTKGPGGVGFLDEVVAIAVAPTSRTPCAVRSDGSAYCWGSNHDKQLGLGVSGNHSRVPVRVGGPDGAALPAGVRQIAPGVRTVCALLEDDTVWCWGDRTFGMLGNGDPGPGNTPSPVQVLGPGPGGNMSGVVSLSAGDYHVCVIRSDATLWCWGRGWRGQLGDGFQADRAAPQRVVGYGGVGHLVSVGLVALGDDHTCAATTAGAMACWGSASQGQLGGGESLSSTALAPVPVTW